ncbi:hypothetical protein V6N11_070713 [Hibiscus sabdariffa]|uniref:Uncharacterized protein n=1 Tax=Hibiscus sabdariffa TaxID=183260 RepID=A0ABR2QFU5_9ROSI
MREGNNVTDVLLKTAIRNDFDIHYLDMPTDTLMHLVLADLAGLGPLRPKSDPSPFLGPFDLSSLKSFQAWSGLDCFDLLLDFVQMETLGENGGQSLISVHVQE